MSRASSSLQVGLSIKAKAKRNGPRRLHFLRQHNGTAMITFIISVGEVLKLPSIGPTFTYNLVAERSAACHDASQLQALVKWLSKPRLLSIASTPSPPHLNDFH